MLTRILHEFRRHRAVRRFQADRRSEPALDRLTEMAAQAFDAPIAVVSLIDRDSLWMKATHGIATGRLPRCETFCNHTLASDSLLEICSPLTDPRFGALPAVVGQPHVRYYIGATIRSAGGFDLGTLCIADTRDRVPASAGQRAYLRALARRATELLELHPDYVMADRR